MFYSLSTDSKHRQKTIFKTVCHTDDKGIEKVIGVHGVGRGIDEIMQGMSIALKCGMTKQQMDDTVGIHPTAAEEFVTMSPKFK